MSASPKFEIVATTGRTVGVPYSLPKVLVLLFQDQSTADAAKQINETVRRVHPEPDDLIVASAVNLAGVPRFMRGMADKMLQKAYQNAAKQLPADVDPADYIVLLPDWGGDLFRLFDVGDVSRKALMVIIDDEGNIVARQQGGNLGKLALRELDKLI